MEKQKKYRILPMRFIPFDLGLHFDSGTKEALTKYLESNYKIIEPPKLLKRISKDVVSKFSILAGLNLYIFSYGVGVFVLQDEECEYKNQYAFKYCEKRKETHRKILEFKYGEISELIQKTIKELRFQVASYGNNKKRIRASANDCWENGGLSYVMTVSYVVEDDIKEYISMTDIEKENLQIMLRPSIVHKEDSLSLSGIYTENKNSQKTSLNIELKSLEIPKNWVKSQDTSIYISWSAVVVYAKPTFLEKQKEILECLEVDLQAMWFYIYSQFDNLKENDVHKNKKASEIKVSVHS